MSNGGIPSPRSTGIYAPGVPIEQPDAWARVGRGMQDVIDPIQQMWLNVGTPHQQQQAAAFRRQRAQNNYLYSRGLLGREPTAEDMKWITRADPYRMLGQGVSTLPLLMFAPESALAATPEALMSWGLTTNVYDALGSLAKKSGLTE